MTDKTPHSIWFEKLVDGTITPREFDDLMDYVRRESTDDQLGARIRQELARMDNGENPLVLHTIVDRVEARLFDHVETPRRNMFLNLKWSWMIAAAAIFLAVISVFWWFGGGHSDLQGVSNEVDIHPGGNRATLALADGRLIDLSDAHSGIVVSEGVRYNDGSEVLAPQTASDNGSLQVEQLVLKTPKGGTYQVQLPDGTKVWLNAASSLTYPIQFSSERREVLLDGEAYFEVSHSDKQPFVVRSGGQELFVLGTTFNVSAYRDDPQQITTLVSGAVSVKSAGREFVLKPGDQLRASAADTSVYTVETSDFIAWKNGHFVFYGEPMSFVIRQIERWYDVSFDNAELAEGITLWGSLSRDVMLSEILQVIEMNTKLICTQQGRRIMIVQQ